MPSFCCVKDSCLLTWHHLLFGIFFLRSLLAGPWIETKKSATSNFVSFDVGFVSSGELWGKLCILQSWLRRQKKPERCQTRRHDWRCHSKWVDSPFYCFYYHQKAAQVFFYSKQNNKVVFYHCMQCIVSPICVLQYFLPNMYSPWVVCHTKRNCTWFFLGLIWAITAPTFLPFPLPCHRSWK